MASSKETRTNQPRQALVSALISPTLFSLLLAYKEIRPSTASLSRYPGSIARPFALA